MHEKLKTLLPKFFNNPEEAKEILTDDIVQIIHEYLFENGPIPFFTNTELFETVVMYLKDLIIDHNFKTLDQLLDYYEVQKNKLRKMFDDINLK